MKLSNTDRMIYVYKDKKITRIFIKAAGFLRRPLLTGIPGDPRMFTANTIVLPFIVGGACSSHAL